VGWRDAARAVVVPYDEDLRVTAQSEAFKHSRHRSFAGIGRDPRLTAQALVHPSHPAVSTYPGSSAAAIPRQLPRAQAPARRRKPIQVELRRPRQGLGFVGVPVGRDRRPLIRESGLIEHNAAGRRCRVDYT
jgi:hypothetical protein